MRFAILPLSLHRSLPCTLLAAALLATLLAPVAAGAQTFDRRPRVGLLGGAGIGPAGRDRECDTSDDYDGIHNSPDLRGPDHRCGTGDDLRIYFWGTAHGRGRGGCFTNGQLNCAGFAGAKSAEWSLTQLVDHRNCWITSTLVNTSDGEPGCPGHGCIRAWSSPGLPKLEEEVRKALDLPPGVPVTAKDGPGPGKRCTLVTARYNMGWNPDTDFQPVVTFGGPLDSCGTGPQPATTLLIPYFQVDPAGLTSVTTLVSINNDSDDFQLARVTLWTDWAVPTLTFHLLLSPSDVQTLNLRDVFAGALPSTADVLADLPVLDFDVCNPEWLEPSLDQAQIEALVADHQGRMNPATGDCAGSPRGGMGPPGPAGILAAPVMILPGDERMTGYITVDSVDRCAFGPTVATYAEPSFVPGTGEPPYFGLVPENALWGDYFFVDPGGNFAQSEPAVHLVRDPTRFAVGHYTFYGRYRGFDASDATAPLGTTYDARFLNGGPFDGGTRLIIWRDNLSGAFERVPCGFLPSWAPLSKGTVKVYDEQEHEFILPGGLGDLCPGHPEAVAFECPVSTDLPFNFGFVRLDLSLGDGTPMPGWVTSLMSAEGRYSINHAATRVDDLCAFPDPEKDGGVIAPDVGVGPIPQ